MNTNNLGQQLKNTGAKALRYIGGTGIVLGMTAVMGISPTYADGGNSQAAAAIEGTWTVAIDPPGDTVPTYLAFVSFTRGGVVSGSPDNHLPPVAGTMGPPSGSWRRTGPNEFASTIVAFTYDGAGKVTGAVRIDSEYRVIDDYRFEGRSRLNLCDLSLQCSSAGPRFATLVGARLPIYRINGYAYSNQ